MSDKKLPAFQTVEEFAEFVEKHVMADYWDELEDVSDQFEFVPRHKRPRPEFTTISFPFPKSALHQLEAIAADEETDVSDLVRTWVAERLAQERQRYPALFKQPTPQAERPTPPEPETATYPVLRPAGAAVREDQEPYK
jgi:hypothetical protein